jgi:endo-1,4-beta-xylanase
MEDFTRRRTFVLGLGMALTACGAGGSPNGGGITTVTGPTPTPTPSPSATPTPTPTATPTPPATGQGIGAAAAAKKMRFGSTFAWSAAGADAGSFANPAYAALLEGNCTVLVPENELKWQATRPTATTYDFSRIDDMLAYAQSKGIALRGHTLLWYVQERFPGWLQSYNFGSDSKTEAQRLVREHIQTVARRFVGKIQSWDVVNEAIDPATGKLRSNSLATAIGGDTTLLDLAFTTARAEMPTAELVYNDYMDAGTPTHRQGVLDLLKGFRARGVPVDTLGVQSHLGFYSQDAVKDVYGYNRTGMEPFLKQVIDMGYKLKITELDVNDARRDGSVASRDADSAALIRDWLDMFFQYGDKISDVLTWGLNDEYSWLQSGDYGKRTDGLPLRPLPYDASGQAKPMRQAIIDAFNATSVRTG